MGKQVRFYSLPLDEEKFWNFTSSIPGAIRLTDKSSMPTVSSFIVPWNKKTTEAIFSTFHITIDDIDKLNPFIRQGSYKVWSEELLNYADTGKQFYWIDIDAPLIEYSSPFIRNDGYLVQGRIWADFYMLQGDQFVYKGDEFKELYETLAAWIRKNFKKIKGVDGYFGKEALVWYQNGGKLFP